MIEGRMDGTTEEQLMFRVNALREAMREVADVAANMSDPAVMIETAENAMVVDNHNRDIMERGPP